MRVQDLKERKKELGYTNEMVARLSGVPLGTVQKIFSGATAAPRLATLQAIEKALFPEAGESGHSMYGSGPAGQGYKGKPYDQTTGKKKYSDFSMVSDQTNLAYKIREEDRQGTYTVEDYNSIPEHVRAELIDGVLYAMGTPTYVHQFILGQIFAEMHAFQRRKGHPCLPFMAPLSVQLDCDDKTMVEPDLMVLCDRGKLQKGIIYGAPELLLEILSPSTRRKDLILKFNKYWNAGVKEYWIVDPKHETVTVHCFDPVKSSMVYTFRDPIPVGISGGELVIDMKEISEQMKELLPDTEE